MAFERICKYAMENLPDDWSIEISLSKEECSAELLAPTGEDIHVDLEPGESSIVTMCDWAKDLEANR